MSGRFGELLLILLIILLLFGAGRLPRLMADVGKSIRYLRQGMSGDDEQKSSIGDKKTSSKQKHKAK